MTKILLVEDNEINQDMLSRRLLRKGFEVVIAENGEIALSMATSAKPDLILMDISLPVMDGWQATRILKANIHTKSIPIIALTAHAMVGDKEKCLAAGCDDYDTKPVEFSRLLEKIQKLLEQEKLNHESIIERKEIPSTNQQTTQQRKDMTITILIVDDNELNRDMLSRRLIRAGYQVLLAESGTQALEIIAQTKVEMVLLDVMMPGISGIDTLRKIRQNYSQSQLPVIMATAKDRTEDMLEAFSFGANDYITKPIDLPLLLARMQVQLNTILAARRESTERSVISESAPATNLQDSQPENLLSNPTPADSLPILLGRYQIARKLIQDEFKSLYLARDIQTNTLCLVEQFLIDAAQPEVFKAANEFLKKELQILQQFASKDIYLKILNCFQFQEKLFLIKEFDRGNLLSSEFKNNKHYSVFYIIGFLMESLKILEVFHQNNLTHQFIKINTIMRRQKDDKLIFFDTGIAARLKNSIASSRILSVSNSSNTMVKNFTQLDVTTDIYALGAIAKQMLIKYEKKQNMVSQFEQKIMNIISKMVVEEKEKKYSSVSEIIQEMYSIPIVSKIFRSPNNKSSI